MVVLKVKNLTKKFKEFTAVDNISFSVGHGEILGLLGPNGAGKTTTIQMLLGVLTPTSGDIVYFGKNFETHREDILNKVNFSTTYTNLPWNLSVRENLTYTSYLYEIDNRKKRIDELIELFRLQEIIEQPISELSAGQLTRVNIAKAFINEPEILLLDEPTASLDPEIATFIRSFIISQSSEKKLSVIFTSHNMTEVEEVCDRILFINNGTIVANDTPKNLMKSMNISHLKLKIDKKDEKILFDYGRKINRGITFEDKEYKIDVEEKEIPGLLAHLYKENVFIYEINIERPTLEDYFLTIAKDNRNKEA